MKKMLEAMMGEDSSSGDMKDAAKLKVLKHLKEMASQMMGDDVKGGMEGLKKVTVAAPDAEGLKSGLDKAKQVVGKMGDFDHDESAEDESPEEEASESPEQEHEEDMSADELEAEIQHLMELKQKLMEKK